MKTFLTIFFCTIQYVVLTQTFTDLFTVNKLIDFGIHRVDSQSDVAIKVKGKEVGVLFKNECSEEHAVFMWYNLSKDTVWEETWNYPDNFQFFVPLSNIRDFDFDSVHLVIRFADLTNYLCVFNRQTGVVESIIPSFEDFRQFRIIGDHIYFGKQYNAHPKQSPYKSIIGRINWKVCSLDAFELPGFELIEFSHFEPNDWFDVNTKGELICAQTVKYEFLVYDRNLKNPRNYSVNCPTWKAVQTEKIQQAINELGEQPSARKVIETLIPWHNTINRIQTIDFLNDSTLIVSKVVENQADKELLRTFDIVPLKRQTGDSVLVPIITDVPDELFTAKEKFTNEHYEYRIREKPHVFYNNQLFLLESEFGELELGITKKVLEKRNNEAALNHEKKHVYLVISIFTGFDFGQSK